VILLLDIGNTRVKWAWLEEFGLGAASAAAHDTTHRAWQQEIETDGRVPHRIVVSNVAGVAVRDVVVDWARGHFSIQPEVLVAERQACGVTNAYPKPEMLGVDRWLGLIAARRASPRATCILNAGTAFTVDALAPDGRHLGGFIIPGVQLLNDSLAVYGAETGLPVDSLHDPYALDLGGDFAMSSIASEDPYADVPPPPGPLALLAAAGDRAARYLAERTGAEPRVVMTGGDSTMIAPLLEKRPALLPDLVMTGLALVATERCG
jgi:type III pantothenate kinase